MYYAVFVAIHTYVANGAVGHVFSLSRVCPNKPQNTAVKHLFNFRI